MTDQALLPVVSEHLPPRTRVSASPVVDQMYSLVGDLDKTRRGARKMYILYSGIDQVVRTSSLDTMLAAFRRDVEETVAIWSPRKLFVHAGVVAWNDIAILIPGRTYTGKTTLVAELVRQGATYMSDEYAVIDTKGRVEAYPRPPQYRDEADSNPVFSGSLRAPRRRFDVGLVVQAPYKEGATWRPRIMTEGRGILALIENTVAARLRPSFAFGRLKMAARGALFLKGARGEASDAAAEILSRASALLEKAA